MAQLGMFPRSAPQPLGLDRPFTARLPQSTVHVVNGSVWCHTQQDLQEILPVPRSASAESGADVGGDDSSSLPSWATGAIVAGVLLMFAAL